MHMTAEEGAALQAKLLAKRNGARVIEEAAPAPVESKLPKPVEMTRPEREMSLILEAQKREGKILEYRFHPIKLAWGVDPDTGKAMIYTPDFLVVKSEFRQNLYARDMVMIETKGSELHQSAITRFKGCRACWPMFSFELHQRDKDGAWRQVL